jgi:tyrosyl-tRNA synthetase
MESLFALLEERGLVDATAGDKLEERLKKPLKVYVGFDPTADSLHLGNFLAIVVLSWFQRFGHTPVVLLGGATGRIGDPSGKSKERPLLDDKTIEHNIASIRKNFEGVLDFSGKLPMPVFVNNNDWMSKFSFVDFLRDVGKSFRIGPMLAKESVRSRVQSEEGMSFTEFSYQLLQSYDFHHLLETSDVCMQIGGSDQWGNITAGIELIRKLTGKSAYGLTLPLLTRSDGKKFGKSEEGAIWLSQEKLSPYKFYQHLVGMPDADVIDLMKKLTFMPVAEVLAIEDSMQKEGYVPNTAQKKLAEELTLMLHGKEGLEVALRVTKGAGPGSLAKLTVESLKEIADDMPNVELPFSKVIGSRFVEVAVVSGLLGSKGEGTRLIQNGGAYLNQEKVTEGSRIIDKSDLIGNEFLVLGSGKKKKILLRLTTG